jgi:Arc/MetJ family transcription regulator
MKVKVDTELLKKARKATGMKSDKLIVENALQLFVTIEGQQKLSSLWGRVKFNGDLYEWQKG